MKFKRITKRTRFTFPCVVAHREDSFTSGWNCWVAGEALDLSIVCTNWLPLQWPEVVHVEQ